MTGLRERLAGWAGVWEGSYEHRDASGTLLDRHASRQETRLEGDLWFERIIYRWGADENSTAIEEVLDFRASFDGDQLCFDDPSFEGQAILVDERIVVFPYRWKGQPGLEIVETIVFPTPDRRTRVWQSFKDGKLERVTLIQEERVEGTPEVWE